MSQDLLTNRIRPFDEAAARIRFAEGRRLRHIVLDDFLADGLSARLSAAYPSFEEARTWVNSYRSAHENRKTQITEPAHFPPAVLDLHETLASPEFLALMSRVTGIPSLLADPSLKGGGMHVTAPGGWLDVHVDFNIAPETGWHRRLNFLLFLNDEWDSAWGGELELWDAEVKRCGQMLEPRLNRCVVFETTGTSYHGVRKLEPAARDRKSFAAYYYTDDAPEGWDDERHSTIFRFRPGEALRRSGAVISGWIRKWSKRR